MDEIVTGAAVEDVEAAFAVDPVAAGGWLGDVDHAATEGDHVTAGGANDVLRQRGGGGVIGGAGVAPTARGVVR